MPDTYGTLAQIAALDAPYLDPSAGIIEQVVNVAPELEKIPVRSIRGLRTEYITKTGLNSSLAWRAWSSGNAAGFSTYAKASYDCFLLGGSYKLPYENVDARVKQGDSFEEAFTILQTEEQKSLLRAKMNSIGGQLWASKSSSDMPGMIPDYFTAQQYMIESRAGFGHSGNICQSIDARKGTAYGSVNVENVYFLRTGPQGFHWIVSGPGPRFLPVAFQEFSALDGSSTHTMGWVQHFQGFLGTAIADWHSLSAITNVTSAPNSADSAYRLTDTMIASLNALIPQDLKPTMAFASVRAILGLQLSRTVTIMANAERPATDISGGVAAIPAMVTTLPTMGNIPIYPTDSIVPAAAVETRWYSQTSW